MYSFIVPNFLGIKLYYPVLKNGKFDRMDEAAVTYFKITDQRAWPLIGEMDITPQTYATYSSCTGLWASTFGVEGNGLESLKEHFKQRLTTA